MKRSVSVFAFVVLLACVRTGASAQMAAPRHWPVIEKYCVECHNTVDWAGGIALDALDPSSLADDAETWEKAIRKMRTGMMPPAG